MRVATVFTGVAAATVGVTQVANAAIRPAGRYAGSIREASNCGERGIDKAWLHVSTTSYGDLVTLYVSDCFGFKGTWLSPPNTGINAECGGGNFGYLIGRYDKGGSWVANFGPATTYHKLSKSHLSTVAIDSWSGNDTCGKAPRWGGGKMT
jgi:hypothetical protein